MKDALTAEKGGYWGHWKKETSQFPMQLFLSCMSDITPCRLRLWFMTLLVLCYITRSSWSINSIGCSKWKRTFSNSNIKDDIAHRGNNFQIESIGDDILLDNRTGWIYEGTSNIMTTWLKSGPTPCRVLAQNQWYTSSNRTNGRCLRNHHDMAQW
jgi:hypothetical protein